MGVTFFDVKPRLKSKMMSTMSPGLALANRYPKTSVVASNFFSLSPGRVASGNWAVVEWIAVISKGLSEALAVS